MERVSGFRYEFYHTTIQKERAFQRRALFDPLYMAQIMRQLARSHLRTSFTEGNNVFTPDSLVILPHELIDTSHLIRMYLSFGKYKQDTNPPRDSPCTGDLLLTSFAGGGKVVIRTEKGLVGEKYLDKLFARTDYDNSAWSVFFPEDITERIDADMQAGDGFPFELADNFGRMFYFSAMTITTVGFGDIAPITPLTRGLVASEAISGIVLIGLFLNALASKASGQKHL